MPVVPVSDAADPRVAHYTALTDMDLRKATELAEGVDFCVSKCRSANNEDDNKCVIAAKTFADARKCTGN